MKLSPLDIRQKRFDTEFRGASVREVEGFLELIASEMEELARENIQLREEQQRLVQQLEVHQSRERALQETMITAQRISEDVKQQANKEADLIVADAELKAEKIVSTANQRLVSLVADINELKRQKVQFESQLDSIIESHRKLLDAFRATATPDLAYLLRKKTAESA